jgi:hypothetical protein
MREPTSGVTGVPVVDNAPFGFTVKKGVELGAMIVSEYRSG